MSVPTDDTGFWARLNNGLNSGSLMNDPLMGLAEGLLQAAGPSRMPTSLGQALGTGLQTGQQFQQAGLQNAMQQLMLGRTGMQLGMLKDALGQTNSPNQPTALPAQPQTNNAAAPQQNASALNGALGSLGLFSSPDQMQNALLNPSITGGASALSPTPQMPQQTTQNMPSIQQTSPIQAQQPIALPRFDPYRDPEYVHDMKMAQVMDMMQPGTGAAYASAGQQRLQDLNNQTLNVTGDQAKQLIPGGLIPGQSIKYHPATGDYSVVGDAAWKDITYTDPVDGQTKHVLWNQQSNQFKAIPGVTGSMPGTTPAGTPPTPSHIPPQVIKAYPGIGDTPGIEKIPAEYLPMVSKIAAGDQDLPTSAKRSPVFEKNLTNWITTINPDWKEQNYSLYGKQMESLTSGADAKKLDPLNTIEGHLDTYRQSMQALNNGNTQLANKLGNAVGLQLGRGPQAAVAAVKQLVSGELAKAVSGGSVGEGDRDQANAVLASYNSPDQTDAVLQKIQQLIGGKLAAIRQRYAPNGLGGYFDMRLNKAAFSAMNDAVQNQTNAPTAPGLPQGWSVQVH